MPDSNERYRPHFLAFQSLGISACVAAAPLIVDILIQVYFVTNFMLNDAPFPGLWNVGKICRQTNRVSVSSSMQEHAQNTFLSIIS